MTIRANEAPVAPDVAAAALRGGATQLLEKLALLTLFFTSAHAGGLLRVLKPALVRLAVACSSHVRSSTRCNATRIFGRELSPREQREFSRGVISNFFDFVTDLGRITRRPIEELQRRVKRIEGEPAFRSLREQHRGAVLVTAHMGAFEIGLAALRRIEPSVHVIFKRDSYGGFEAMRSRVRNLLGVNEIAIDDGFDSLVRLRDALRNDGIVVMQADRAMPGQRSQVVQFLHGHLRLPLGPVKVAQLTGSPIVPVFLVRTKRGGFDVHLCDSIEIDPNAPLMSGVDPALLAIARSLEVFVARYPQQWLVLERAFVEDAERAR